MRVYFMTGHDATENEFLGHANTQAEAEALALAAGVQSPDASDTCDDTGSTTDDDDARVWLVGGVRE